MGMLLVMVLLPCNVWANIRPVGTPQTVSVDAGAQVTITLTAFDPDGDPLTYKISKRPTKGTATQLNAGGSQVLYTPKANFSGKDSFSFTVSDGKLTSTAVSVAITIVPVNIAPVVPASVSMRATEDQSASLTLRGTDSNRDKLSYAIQSQAVNGRAVISGTKVIYTPAPNFFGTDSFTYTAFDGKLHSAPGRVAVTVTGVNDAPIALAQSVEIPAGTSSTTINLEGSDVDGDALTYAIAKSPKPRGTISALNGNRVTYTLGAGVVSDSFAFTVRDKKRTSGAAVVTISVVTPPPVTRITDPDLLRCVGGTAPEATAQSFICDGIDLSAADLSQLARLPNLRTLDLSHTKLTNISGLAGLTTLTTLDLAFNSIADISPLAGMKDLTYLDVSFNALSGSNALNALSGMSKLTELYLDANKITGIGAGATSPLAGKPLLAKLALDDNQLTDISALSTLSGLTHVGLGYNNIADVTALAGKPLQVLVLDANHLTNLTTLPKPNTLEALYLRGNGSTMSNVLTDVSPLYNAFPNLRVLELGFNNISDASPLRALTNLTRLGLEANNLANVNTLSGLTKLMTLDLEHNQLVSTDGIAKLASSDGLLRLNNNRLLDDDLMALAVRGDNYHLRIDDNCLSNFPFAKSYGKAWQFPAARCGGTAPVAMGDDVNIPQNTATTIPLLATDPNGDSLTYKIEAISLNGGTLNASVGSTVNGFVVFTPSTGHLKNAGFFKFSATDSNGEKSQVVTVNLWVVPAPLVSCYGTVEAVPQSVYELNDGVCTGKNLTDISWLPTYSPGLTKLYLGGNPNITDYTPLASLTNLKALSLAGNNLSPAALDVVKNLTSVDILELNQCQLDNADIAKLGGMTWLTYLFLDDNDITDISSLSNLTRLSVLHLSDSPTKAGNNAITDIRAIQTPGMPYLQNITLNGNNIGGSAKQAGNLAALASRTSLSYIELDDNGLTSVDGLATIPDLDTLTLRKNRLQPTALDAFKHYPNSLALYVEQNCLNSADLKTGWVAHVTRDTSGNQCGLVDGTCPPYFDAARSCAPLP